MIELHTCFNWTEYMRILVVAYGAVRLVCVCLCVYVFVCVCKCVLSIFLFLFRGSHIVYVSIKN